MKKKIFVGSIIAVSMLISLSFTSVIGYNNFESDSISISPLFKVRTARAIGEQSQVIHRQYVSNGITLWFPKRDEKTILIQKVVDSIRMMDDKTFERFIKSVIDSAQRDNKVNDLRPDEIRKAFDLFRNNDKLIPIFYADSNINPISVTPPTCLFTCTCPITFSHGIGGILYCIAAFALLILVPLNILFNIILKILTIKC